MEEVYFGEMKQNYECVMNRRLQFFRTAKTSKPSRREWLFTDKLPNKRLHSPSVALATFFIFGHYFKRNKLPLSSTQMRSASLMVDSRCAMVIQVRPLAAFSKASETAWNKLFLCLLVIIAKQRVESYAFIVELLWSYCATIQLDDVMVNDIIPNPRFPNKT